MRTPELETTILNRLAEGESLRGICKSEGMPTEGAVRKWVREDPDGFGTHYARARELGYEALADEILDIADDNNSDTRKTEDGHEMPDHEWMARARLRVDTRKWLLSKMLPKVFGDKLDVTSDGKELAAPIVGLQVVAKSNGGEAAPPGGE